jgi:DNA-binding CsgD family transcriptional regulator
MSLTTADESDQPDPKEIAAALDRRLSVPTLTFPDGWTLSGAWRRAQEARAHVGPVTPAEFDVMLSRPDSPPDLSDLTDAEAVVYHRVEQHDQTAAQAARDTERHPSTARTLLRRAREKVADLPPEWGDRHRVLFALHDRRLAAECDCEAHRWDGWCAHLALLWWRWVRGKIAVTDLDDGREWLTPPEWLSVTDETHPDTAAEPRPARTDGGDSQ